MTKKNNNQTVIRGAAAFFILLTHITAFTSGDNIFKVFTPFGYLWVGIFFFYSGYNLVNSYQNNDKFFDKFWLKKILRIYLPFVISNILFLIIRINFNGEIYGKKDMIEYIVGIKCINDVNWYIYSIMIFYFCAWLFLFILSKIKNVSKKKIAILIASIIIYIVYGKLYFNIAWDLHMTTSIRNVYPLTMLIGMIYSVYKDKINQFIEKPTLYETVLLLLFFVSCIFHYAAINKYNFYFINPEISDYIVPITFTIMIMLISTKVTLQSKFYGFIDKISLETYIFHFVILNLYCNNTIKFENSYLFLVVYILTTIVLSLGVNKLSTFLIKKVAKK